MDTQLNDLQAVDQCHQKQLLQDEQFISAYRMNNAKAIMDDGLWSQKQEPVRFDAQPAVKYCASVQMEAVKAYEHNNLPEATFHNERLYNLVDKTLRFQDTKELHNFFKRNFKELSKSVMVRGNHDFDAYEDREFVRSFRCANSDKIKRNEEVDQFRMYQRNGDLLGVLHNLGGAHDREKLNLTGVESYCRNIEKLAIRAIKTGNTEEANHQISREWGLVNATYHPSKYTTPDVPKSAFEQRPEALSSILQLEPKSRNAAIEKWLERLKKEGSE